MSLNQNQQAIVDAVLNSSLDYEKCGQMYLNNATAAQVKAIEEEQLKLIGDKTLAGNDDEVIRLIAEWERTHSTIQDKTINLYTLIHKSWFSTDEAKAIDGVGHGEVCCTPNSLYLNIANPLVSTITPSSNFKLNTYEPGKFIIGTSTVGGNSKNVTYVGEKNKLYGRSKDYAFSYSTGTAACVYGNGFSNPVVYDGYCFEAMRGRDLYATGGAASRRQCFLLTKGGGPAIFDGQGTPSDPDWIIQLNETNDRTIEFERDTSSRISSPWVLNKLKDGEPVYYCYLKIWIHFFFPDGSYVRTIVDRSNSAGILDAHVDPSMQKTWIYTDYRNSLAAQNSYTFKSVWNNMIYNKRYRPVGGYDPKNLDISRFWNGKLDADLQNRIVALKSSDYSTQWKGGGFRQ